MKEKAKVFLGLLAFLFALCAEKKGEDALERKIEHGFELIEEGFIESAEEIFSELKLEHPENCKVAWGVIFVNLKKFENQLNKIIATFTSISEEGQNLPRLSPTGEVDINSFLEDILFPFFDPIKEISENTKIVMQKKCQVKLRYRMTLGSQKSPLVDVIFDGLWGPTEASVMNFTTNFFNALVKFILSINFNVNIRAFFDIVVEVGSQRISQASSPGDILRSFFDSVNVRVLHPAIIVSPDDTVGLFSSLAWLVESSPNALKLKPGAEIFIDDVARSLSEGFKSLSNFFSFIVDYSSSQNIIAFEDILGDGATPDDSVGIRAFSPDGEPGMWIGDFRVDILISSFLVRPILYPGLRKEIISFLEKWAKAFDIYAELDEKERWVRLSDFNTLLLSIIAIPDTILFNPKNFFEGLKKNPEGLRALLPYWTDLDGDGYPEFLIEAETKVDPLPMCFAPEDTEVTMTTSPYIELYSTSDKNTLKAFVSFARFDVSSKFSCDMFETFYLDDKYRFSSSAKLKISSFEYEAKTLFFLLNLPRCQTGQDFPLCADDEQKEVFVFVEGRYYPLSQVLASEGMYEILNLYVLDLVSPPEIQVSLHPTPSYNKVKVEFPATTSAVLTLVDFEPNSNPIPDENFSNIFKRKCDFCPERYLAFIRITKSYLEKISNATAMSVEEYRELADAFENPDEGYPLLFRAVKRFFIERDFDLDMPESVLVIYVPSKRYAVIGVRKGGYRSDILESTKRFIFGEEKDFVILSTEYEDIFLVKNPRFVRCGSVCSVVIAVGSDSEACFKSPSERENAVCVFKAHNKICTQTIDVFDSIPPLSSITVCRSKYSAEPSEFDLEFFEDNLDSCLVRERRKKFSVFLRPGADGKLVKFSESVRKAHIFEGLAFGGNDEEDDSIITVPQEGGEIPMLKTEIGMTRRFRQIGVFWNILSFPQNHRAKEIFYLDLGVVEIGCSFDTLRCFFWGDSPHFPSSIIFKGAEVFPRTAPDCFEPYENWSFYYVAWRDPTVFGSVKVNLANTVEEEKPDRCFEEFAGKVTNNVQAFLQMCKSQGDKTVDECWTSPDLWAINRVISHLFSTTISPIISLIYNFTTALVSSENLTLVSGNLCEW